MATPAPSEYAPKPASVPRDVDRRSWLLGMGAAIAASCLCKRPPERASISPLSTGPLASPPSSSRIRRAHQLDQRLDSLREGGRHRVPYYAPSEPEWRAYRDWVRSAAVAASDGPHALSAPPDGFVLDRLSSQDGELWVLCEQVSRRRGAGVAVLRVGRARPLMVQAPHSFFDEATLPLATTVFERGGCRALASNTVHRYRALGCEGEDQAALEKACVSDVAHSPGSYFAAAHEALLSAWPGITTVQLHGFADSSVDGVSVVVSASGTLADPSPVARALGSVFGVDRVRIYPDEVDVLGGTRNVQALASRRARSRFIHLEISRQARGELMTDAARRERFADALVASLRESASGPH